MTTRTRSQPATRAKAAKTEQPLQKAVQPRGDAVVEKILAGGMDIFLEHGFAGTSVDAVAQVTRTSKATIYRYFPTKEALFTAMVDRAIEEGRRLPKVDPGRHRNVRDLLLAYAEECIRKQVSPRQIRLCRVYISEIQKFAVIEKLFSRFDERDTAAFTAYFAELFSDRLKNFTNPKRTAETFSLLVLQPFTYWALFRPRSFETASDRQQSLENLIDEFLKIYPPA